MEAHQWINSMLAVAVLVWSIVWSIFLYRRDKKPRIKLNCTVSPDPTLTGKKVMPDSFPPEKMMTFSVTNIGSIPALVVDVVVSFKQINYSKDKPIIKICSAPMLLGMKGTKDVEYSLRNLWVRSLSIAPYRKIVTAESKPYHKKICDIETIYVEDSLGNKWKANSEEVKHINSELLGVAFESSD